MTEELSLEARELIERATREEAQASDEVLARIRRQVFAVGAAAGTISAAGKVAAAGASSTLAGATNTALASSVFTSLLLGAALGVGVTVGPQLFDSTERHFPSASSASAGISKVVAPARAVTQLDSSEPLERSPSSDLVRPAPFARAETPSVSKVRSVETPKARTTPERRVAAQVAARAQPSPAERSAPSEPGLHEELALLERVQVALRAGNGTRALELLDARPTTRQLTAEYLAAEVFAACQIGQRERARSAAERFLRQHPTGPLASRVRNSCAGLGPGAPPLK